MSLRRRIALWLCPELNRPVGEPIVSSPQVPHEVELLRALEEWEMELDVNDRLLNTRLINAKQAAAKANFEARSLMNKMNS